MEILGILGFSWGLSLGGAWARNADSVVICVRLVVGTPEHTRWFANSWFRWGLMLRTAQSTFGRASTVVLVGVHGAGKSTAAMSLASFGYMPHLEIGWAYRQAILYSNPGTKTLAGPDLAWFDTTVLALEQRRDKFIESVTVMPHCIETWHLGNLAYACLRSPQLVPAFERALISGVRKLKPLFVILSICEAAFKDRRRLLDLPADELYEFYCRIDSAILEYAVKHKLDYVLLENNGQVSEFLAALKATLGLQIEG